MDWSESWEGSASASDTTPAPLRPAFDESVSDLALVALWAPASPWYKIWGEMSMPLRRSGKFTYSRSTSSSDLGRRRSSSEGSLGTGDQIMSTASSQRRTREANTSGGYPRQSRALQ
jgi:hypothetical protein